MFVWVKKMLQHDRIDVSEGIDINETSESWVLCHYWYFKDTDNKSQRYLCNGCHGVSMMAYE